MRHLPAILQARAAVIKYSCILWYRLAADEVEKKLADMRVQLEAEVQKGTVAAQP